MILPTGEKHRKHEKLAKPIGGDWHRCELAILGTDCNNIKALAYSIIEGLPQLKIGYADADHKNSDDTPQNSSCLQHGGYAEYIDKISFTRLDTNTQPNAFQKRAMLNQCDIVLVNGNHFTAEKQIVVIDEAKPLHNKLNRLTDVLFIILVNESGQMEEAVKKHLSQFPTLPVVAIGETEKMGELVAQYVKQKTAPLQGLVLSGGKSTRMGTDKGLLQYHGETQRRYLHGLLSSFCKDVFVSCNEDQAKEETLPFIKDAFLGLGPLSGILSAFQQNVNSAWLAIACDLPYLDADTIQYLIDHRNPAKMATCFMDSEGKFPEPLITIWEPKAYSVLLQFLSLGYSCPRKALINSDVEMLTAPNVFAFKNINTTEEYREVVKEIENKHNYC